MRAELCVRVIACLKLSAPASTHGTYRRLVFICSGSSRPNVDLPGPVWIFQAQRGRSALGEHRRIPLADVSSSRHPSQTPREERRREILQRTEHGLWGGCCLLFRFRENRPDTVSLPLPLLHLLSPPPSSPPPTSFPSSSYLLPLLLLPLLPPSPPSSVDEGRRLAEDGERVRGRQCRVSGEEGEGREGEGREGEVREGEERE